MPLISTRGAASAQGFGEFAQSGPVNYIEDVFSTYLYTGNGSTQTITNGIDLSGKGGMVWIKSRSNALDNAIYDTARGNTKVLFSNLTVGDSGYATTLTAFNSNGFSVDKPATGTAVGVTNTNAYTYASWTFRKQEKFFDVVAYTGTGSNRTVDHNLGSVPGCIIVKRTDSGGTLWAVYHRSLGATQDIALNSTAAAGSSTLWNSTAPTITQFTVGTLGAVNASGGTYVAYLFAHDAGGFGLSGTDNVISCGSYTGNGSANGPEITLGYEPQWVLIKDTTTNNDWQLLDSMRGLVVGGADAELNPNNNDAESSGTFVSPLATGFRINTTAANYNANGSTYIYIAIRRGPMKVPTSGTSVFVPIARAGTSATANISTGFVTDATIIKNIAGGFAGEIFDRLRGANKRMYPDQVSAESTTTDHLTSFATNDGYTLGASASGEVNLSGYNYANWNFRRAPGFFDVVCYTGTGSNSTVAHNLGVAPEFIIVKQRATGGTNWRCYHSANLATNGIALNLDLESFPSISYWNDTAPTSSVFSVGTSTQVNASGGTYIAYLFATVAGVSKVGSYTGSGTTKQIDCGFTAGARFVLIKRTDSTGDWYVWDSARGIVASTDPYLVLNSTAAEVTTTDWVDTYSAGFELSSAAGNNVNINAASYIFLSIS